MNFRDFKSTHSGRLDRWLGKEKTAELSNNMRGWYGPPIALQGVPGSVFATKDGDFIGDLRDGWEVSMMDHAWDLKKRLQRAARVASGQNRNRLNAGFTSLSDLIAEATSGNKSAVLHYSKRGASTVAGDVSSLWAGTGHPGVGAVGVAAPGGAAQNSNTTGALLSLATLTGGDLRYAVSSLVTASTDAHSTLLYDRLFAVKKNVGLITGESVTGVPTRYQGTTPGNVNYSGGNFLFIETETTISSTAHNWTVCTYSNQSGVGKTLPSVTGISGATALKLDQPSGTWFVPLATGDVGLTALTQLQQSAILASGAINFVIGHPIAWTVHAVANFMCASNYTNSAFNLVPILDAACLSFIDMSAAVSVATIHNGSIVCVAG